MNSSAELYKNLSEKYKTIVNLGGRTFEGTTLYLIYP